jgi:N-acetylmuramic acid 6-phosphate etherase
MKGAALSRLSTEQQNPASEAIDRQPTTRILEIINEQDATVAAAVGREIPNIARAVDAIVASLEGNGRLFFVGAGTSGRLGCLDASEIPPTFNTSPSLVQGVIAGGRRALTHATETSEDDPALGRRDLQKRRLRPRDVVVGITASGRTPYPIGALEYARKMGCATIALTSNPKAPISRVAEVTIAPQTGPEVIAGSTRMKAGTAQKMVLNMLTTAAMIRLGHVYSNYMVNVHLKNQKLRERGLTILQRALGLDRAAAQSLLRRSGRNLKVAILMHQASLSRREAKARLRQQRGRLV